MPDVDFDAERALATLLERPLAEAETLPDLQWRAGRIRRRRWGTRLGLAAGAAALAIVVVALLPNATEQVVRTTPPADVPEGPREPPPPPPIDSPRDLPRVASITVAGEEWFLLAGYDANGGL